MIYIIRGLPGAGKTTHAKQLLAADIVDCIHAADDHFTRDGEYRFNRHELPRAHSHCQFMVETALRMRHCVAAHNTFSRHWEMAPYLRLADRFDMAVEVIDLFDGGLADAELASRCTHGVPRSVIAQMRRRWDHLGDLTHYVGGNWYNRPA